MPQDEEAIPLEGDELEAAPTGTAASAPGAARIQAFGRQAVADHGQVKFNRPLNVTGAGATRCRIFHSKVTVAALEHMVSQVNEWLDGEKIEIKCVNQVVGVLEGKTPEPNLIVMVWY